MPEDDNGRDAKDSPQGGVHSFGEVTDPRDRKMIELYEGDEHASTDSVGKELGISGVRVSQRLDYWYALGIDLPKWAKRRKPKEFTLPEDRRSKR